MGCPDDDALALLLGGEALDDAALHAHIDECPRCAAMIVELGGLYHEAEEDETDALTPGTSIAWRYRLERSLGRGGMGVVFLALDVQLDREVAIKLVRPEVAAEHGDELQARLHREARAMARISDPEVVPVLDVGRWRGLVYVVMERVDGITLRAWLHARPRTRAEILHAMIAAGRGLRAAHRAGVVHRDFKPENVLVGHDGRVRVTDFGMARLPEADASTPSSPLLSSGLGSGSGSAIATQTGAVMGTPAYMAPEQLDGLTVTARSDQYAWCVMLAEALTGERPYAGRSLYALREAQHHEPAGLERVPSQVRRVLQRGLREDPRARWPDLEEALHALERADSRRWSWSLGAVAMLALGGWWMLPGAAASLPSAASRGAAGETAVHTAWSRAIDEHARAASAAESPAVLETELRHYAEALEAAYHRCNEARPLPFAIPLEQALDCLDGRRARLEPILERWASAPDEDLLDTVTGLQPPSACFGVDQARPLPREPARAQEARRLQLALDESWSYLALGELDETEQRLRALEPEVEALGFAPLHAQWGLQLGRVLVREAAWEPAIEQLEAAYWEAEEAGSHRIAVRCATTLFELLGDTQGRFEESDRWARHAEASLQRADDALARYYFHQARATVEIRRVDPGAARHHAERSLAVAQRLWPPGHRDVVTAEYDLALVDIMQGDHEAAEARLRHAIEAREQRYGDQHVDLAPMLQALAEVVAGRGQLEEAEAMLERALAIAERAYGPEHPSVSDSRNGLAIVAMMRGDEARAEQLFRTDLAQIEAKWGPSNERAVRLRTNLGNLELELGKLEQAKADLEQVLGYRQEASDTDGLDLVPTLILLAEVEQRREHEDVAAAHLERVMGILEGREDEDPKLLAVALEHRGALREARGQHAEASADLERAKGLREAMRVKTSP